MMNKRITAIILTLALIVGIMPAVPFVTAAATTQRVAEPAYQASYAAGATVDGSVSEVQWQMDGYLLPKSSNQRFGVLWNQNTLYFALQLKSGDSVVSLTLNGYAFTVKSSGITYGGGAVSGAAVSWGSSYVEVSLPISAFGFKVHDYSQYVTMSLSTQGKAWEGKLYFNSQERNDSAYSLSAYEAVSITSGDYEALSTEEIDGGYDFRHVYLSNGNNVANARVSRSNLSVSFLANRSQSFSMEYDFYVENMPVYSITPQNNSYLCHGFSMVLTDGNRNGILYGITNGPDGLYLMIRNSRSETYDVLPLGKQVGEKFHVRTDWTINGDLWVYIDGEKVIVSEQAQMDKDRMQALHWGAGSMIMMNLITPATLPTSSADDAIVAVTDLRYGYVPYESVLDTLDFEDICGMNSAANSVFRNLSLPAVWGNTQLRNVPINWSSSNTQAIDSYGNVMPGDQSKQVTMTAQVTAYPAAYKKIDVNVRSKFLGAVYTGEALTVDGALTEQSWKYANSMDIPGQESTAPSGNVRALMQKGIIYLAVSFQKATALKLELGSRQWTIDLTASSFSAAGITGAIGSDALELRLDMPALGLQITDYNQEKYTLQLTLSATGAQTQLNTSPVWLIAENYQIRDTALQTNGNVLYPQKLETGVLTNAQLGSQLMSVSAKDAYDIYGKEYSGYTKIYMDQIDHSQDITLYHTITIHKMPSGTKTGSYTAPSDYYGLVFWIQDATASALVTANVHHSGDGKLKLTTLRQGNVVSDATDLGVCIGDTFSLQLTWTAANQLKVYVNGVLKGQYDNATYTQNMWSMNTISMRYRDTACAGNATASFEVSDIRMTVGSQTVVPDFMGENAYLNYSTLAYSPVKFQGSNAVDYSTGASWIKENITELSAGRNMLLELDLDIQSMSYGPKTGTFSTMQTGSGFLILLEDGQSKYMYANVYRDVNGDLLITGALSYLVKSTPIRLNRKVTDRFKLGLEWTDVGTLAVYVDGGYLGQIQGVEHSGKVHGKPTVALRYMDASCSQSNPANISIYSIALTKLSMPGYNYLKEITPLAEELPAGVVLSGKTLDALTGNITLPASATSAYLGTLPLTWETDDAALSAQGIVTRPTGRVGRYVGLTALVAGQQKLWTVDCYVVPLDGSTPASPGLLRAPYAATVPTIEGSVADAGWNLNTRLMSGNTIVGRFGVQWNASTLYLAAEGSGTLSVTLNGRAISLSGALSGTVKEVAIPFSQIGITPTDYGVQIPAKIQLGSGVWQGTIQLTSTQWAVTDSGGSRAPLLAAGTSVRGDDQPTERQGYEKLTDGYRLFDLYSSSGKNPTLIGSYVIFGNDDCYASIKDLSVSNYITFDFCAAHMPEYPVGQAIISNSANACYGFSFYLSMEEDADRNADIVSGGIVNTPQGLYFVLSGAQNETVALNKKLGDLFRIGIQQDADGTVTLFVDGVKTATFANGVKRGSRTGTCILNMCIIRSEAAARNHNDDMDITITNVAVGKSYGETRLDSLDFNTIKGSNTDPYSVTQDLQLPASLTNQHFTSGQSISWSSSDAAVVNPTTGKVTRPTVGKEVVLTAISGGKTKQIVVYVLGTGTGHDVLVKENDLGTQNGAGVEKDVYLFTLDTTNNSVIYDLGAKQAVSVVALKDSDTENRLNESVLTIWYSDDNVTYTMVETFKLLKKEQYVYLYDFHVEARYIKVHCTHYDGAEASFTAPLAQMIRAYDQEHFGAEGSFSSRKNVTLTNDKSYVRYDDAWEISKTEAGVTGMDASIRVYLGEELLYHYVDGDNIVVRIPEVAADGSVTLTVLSGNSTAMDISNQEYVHEVVYGTRESYNSDKAGNGGVRLTCALNDGVMLGIRTIDAGGDGVMVNNFVFFNYSYDGGMSWTPLQPIHATIPQPGEEATGYMVGASGVSYDPDYGDQGRIILLGSDMYFSSSDHTQASCNPHFVYSDDLGQTWHRSEDMNILPSVSDSGHYVLTYTAPVVLSTNDADGPNVDYVVPFAALYNDNGGFCCRVAYTTDAGINWTLGSDEILYEGEDVYFHEVGVSEATILETASGRLVLYARCQFGDCDHFARSYSDDHGLSWKTDAELGDLYTVNTQPMMHQYGNLALMTWAGNTVLGGNSYARFPMCVAYSTDGLMTFENIQNLYSRYSLQGLTQEESGMATNQYLGFSGDTMVMTWGFSYNSQVFVVRNFTDYFMRTKGAFDSFEKDSIKYEGWTITSGSVARTQEHTKHGSYSMRVSGGSGAVRSIPYLQNGSIAFDLYLEDLDCSFEVELESAYGTKYGQAAPIAFAYENRQITFLGAQQSSGETLQLGWNHVVFDLQLAQTTPQAFLSVNGRSAVAVPVDLEIGDYVCYVDVQNTGAANVYVDTFCVTDTEPIVMPAEIVKHSLEKVEARGATFAQTGVKEHYACKDCGAMFWDEKGKDPVADPQDVVIPKLDVCDHAGIVFTSDNNATCTENGTKSGVCPICREIVTETVINSSLGHKYTMEGDYKVCSRCHILKPIDSITITKKPTKLTYLEGKDALDVTGGEITVRYTDRTTMTVALKADMVTGFDNTLAKQQTLTVTYGGKTAAYQVEVIAKSLTSIAVTTEPTKLTYLEGKDALDVTGGVITLYYDNGTSETKPLSAATVTGFDNTQVKEQTLTVTYAGKTAAYQVEVIAKSLTSIAVTTEPTKLTYLEGKDALDVTGGVITLYYDNGTSETKPLSAATVTGFDNTQVKEQTLTVTYGGKTAAYQVEVIAKRVSSIQVTAQPDKLEYVQGEALSTQGGKITVYYNNDTSDVLDITANMVTGFDPEMVGSQTLTVTYGEKTAIIQVRVKSRVPNQITATDSDISVGDTYISKLSEKTTVSALLAKLDQGQYCKVYKGETEVSGDALVGTGMTVKLVDGNTVKQTLTIVVTGDTNGDGSISITDMLTVKSHVLEKTALSGAAAKAADTNGDGDISITDFLQVKFHILEKKPITPKAC